MTAPTPADFVVVDRLITGQPINGPIRRAEREEAIRRLAQQRYTDGQIATRLGTWSRSVHRTRRRLGIPAAGATNQNHRVHAAPSRPKEHA
jgi:hypothetical protein